MPLSNQHLIGQLEALSRTADEAAGALAKSDDLPPENLAETMVDLGKLRAKAAKLREKITKLAAPLFNAGNGAASADEDKARGKKR